MERKLKKSEVNHLDVLAVRHPGVSPSDKGALRFLWWRSASGRAAPLTSQRLLLVSLLLLIRSTLSCHHSSTASGVVEVLKRVLALVAELTWPSVPAQVSQLGFPRRPLFYTPTKCATGAFL